MAEASLNLWYEALGSANGIAVQTNDPVKLRQRLYKFREDAGDPMLKGLSIVISPSNPANQLWIVKRKSNEA